MVPRDERYGQRNMSLHQSGGQIGAEDEWVRVAVVTGEMMFGKADRADAVFVCLDRLRDDALDNLAETSREAVRTLRTSLGRVRPRSRKFWVLAGSDRALAAPSRRR